MKTKLSVGQEIPDFETTDFEGHPITKEDFLGGPFLIYFYPKDDSPGCTQQACEFRDLMEGFDDLDVMVVGVSRDSVESHIKFMEKHHLNFPLLSDSDGTMSKQFGVLTEENGKESYARSTFLCDEDGIIQWMESPVTVEGHGERVLKAIGEVLA